MYTEKNWAVWGNGFLKWPKPVCRNRKLKQWLLQTLKKEIPNHYGFTVPHLNMKNCIRSSPIMIMGFTWKTYVFSISALSCTNWTHDSGFLAAEIISDCLLITSFSYMLCMPLTQISSFSFYLCFPYSSFPEYAFLEVCFRLHLGLSLILLERMLIHSRGSSRAKGRAHLHLQLDKGSPVGRLWSVFYMININQSLQSLGPKRCLYLIIIMISLRKWKCTSSGQIIFGTFPFSSPSAYRYHMSFYL